ncbi:MAG: hypothetical protein ACWA47_08830 [Brevirhabdus sp.]
MQADPTKKTPRPEWAGDETTVIFESHNVRAYMHDPGGKRLVVMFDHRRTPRTGFPPLSRVQFFRSHNYATLHVDTARNDWFLSPDLAQLRKALQAATQRYRFRTAMGFSMGGFGALLFARALKLRQALLVSPQISVIPDRVPWDRRFREDALGLDPALDDVSSTPWEGMTGVTLFDPGRPLDRHHARQIQAHYPGIRPVAMPFGGHPASAPLTEAGLFEEIQSLVAGGLVEPARFTALRRRARSRSAEYERNYNSWLQKRIQRG